MRALFLGDRVVAEGGGAVGAAALLAGKTRPAGPTAVIVSGQNVDMVQFLRIANGESITVGEVVVKG
jgi:threonine dehydratase